MTKKIAILVASLGFIAFAATSCGDDDPSGPGTTNPPSTLSSYQMKYAVVVTDPNIFEVADVVVEYIDTPDTVVRDTVKSGEWSKLVKLNKSKTVRYGLEARLFAKDNATLTQSQYDFHVNIASQFFNVFSNGEAYYQATFNSDKAAGIFNRTSTKVAKAELQGEEGKQLINSSSTYFCRSETQDVDTLTMSVFPWK